MNVYSVYGCLKSLHVIPGTLPLECDIYLATGTLSSKLLGTTNDKGGLLSVHEHARFQYHVSQLLLQKLAVQIDTLMTLRPSYANQSSRLLCRSHQAGVQIDRTAVQQSTQRHKANRSDPYSMYHSKALKAELQLLDAQDRLSERKTGSASIA